jgi:DNA-binding CsgD family transcriptional regulator
MGVNMPTSLRALGPADGSTLPTLLRSAVAAKDMAAEDPSVLVVEIVNALRDAVVLTDRAARVLYLNRSARDLVSRRLIAVRSGQLCAALPTDTQKLHAVIAAALRGEGSNGHMRLGSRLVATVIALGGERDGIDGPQAAAILVNDLDAVPIPSAPSISAYFGLTPAEARLAQEILKGDGLARCARRLGTRITTVRSHLKHVFEKTETKRQAHLVRLMLRCGSCIAVPPPPADRAPSSREPARPHAGL